MQSEKFWFINFFGFVGGMIKDMNAFHNEVKTPNIQIYSPSVHTDCTSNLSSMQEQHD